MIYTQTRICPRKEDFAPNLDQKNRPVLITKKERTCHLMDLVVLADYKVKIKENEAIKEFMEFAWERKKMCSMKLTMLLIIV